VLWIEGLTAVLLVEGRKKIAVMAAVTALLIHHSTVDRGTDCSIVSTG